MKYLYNKKIVNFLVILTLGYVLYYFYWRITKTINYSALVFSIILLLGELYGVFNSILFFIITKNIEKEQRILPLEGVSVDVFVPTYNEDIEVLEATLIGCINMRYKHTTYVLDDGNRDAVKKLAQDLGCNYIARSDNKHAKAGNINEALKNTDGEFIVILDADTVPQPDLIEKTLGYFKDAKTAIVQMPQEFYNLDSAQHKNNASHWHEQQLFYHVIQPGRNSINAAFWCGSPSIVRREALESVGGVATDSITEDFLTSIRLNAKGWNIKYHNEALAFGIAPQSIHAFNLQRLRWAQGAMKVFKSKDNPLIVPGLTIKQRLAHFSAIFTYFESYQKLIYLLVPAIFLITGVMPLRVTSGVEFLIHWAPCFFLLVITNKALGRGYFKYLAVEEYNILKMFTFIKASFSLLIRKKISFRVTPKSVESSAQQKDKHEIYLHFVILAFIIFSVIFGAVNLVGGTFLVYPSATSAFIAIFWSVFNSTLIFLILRDVLRRIYYRHDYRFHVQLTSRLVELTGTQLHATVNDISSSGIGLTDLSTDMIEGKKKIRVCLPDGVLDVTGLVEYNRELKDGSKSIGLKFDNLSHNERIRLLTFLYVIVPRHIYNSINNVHNDIEYFDNDYPNEIVGVCDFS